MPYGKNFVLHNQSRRKSENHSRRVEFPFLVDSSRSKIRVARRQCWIEVCVMTSPATHQKGYRIASISCCSQQEASASICF